MPRKLSHYDASGRASMVDVSGKQPTVREAEAGAFVAMSPAVIRALPQNPKGDPLEVARIAGIQAAKRTSELIPMCHPIPLSKIDVEANVESNGVMIRSHARTTAVTGVGPAYQALLAEAQVDAAVRHGLGAPLAGQLVAETMSGTAALLADHGYDTLAVRREVTSPGGSTARGLEALERGGIRAAFQAATDAVIWGGGR